MGQLHQKGFGFLKSYSIASIGAGATSKVSISDTDLDFIQFFNVIDITNNSTVDIDVYLDGNTARTLRVIAGTTKSMNGTRFREIVVYNRSGATATGDNNVNITVQKELGRREEIEIKSI